MGQDLATRLKTKVEELVARYETLARENADMKARLDRCEKAISKKDLKIKELEKKIENLRLKEAFLGTTGDRTQAKRKVAKLIKEIDACVSLLDE
jgi:chromosome segregation ATPase